MVRTSSLEIGKQLYGDYCLRRLLGRGSFGSVWEAGAPDGRIAALKFIPCGNKLAAAQEIRAIQFFKELRHPNLMPVEQVWCYRNYVVVTMPLADGSLLDLLDAYANEYGTPMDGIEVCLYLAQAARALDFLNARQHLVDGQRVAFQHCDIKPSNLLLFGDTVKLADFGLSSPTCGPVKFHRRAGTPAYMAPEVFQERLSDWTDQYALAVSYCHLRGGRLPFGEEAIGWNSRYQRPAPDLTMLPVKERPIIARALAVVPQDRWPTCAEMLAQLTKAVKG